MNPLEDGTAGTYEFNDVLLWPFWGKGKNVSWINTYDKGLFE
jgi:hypothetical protein